MNDTLDRGVFDELTKSLDKPTASPTEDREKICAFENELKKQDGAMLGNCFPLDHVFTPGLYIRTIHMPKGFMLTSRIHRFEHPFFVTKGEVSVFNSEEGTWNKIKAPYQGITPSGTKRILYIHEDTDWTTFHVTKETNVDKIEKMVTAESFKELDGSWLHKTIKFLKKLGGLNVKIPYKRS